GARRNERIAIDGRAFRVGSDPDCEVFFDPHRDPAVQGRSAQFHLREDGWHVRCAGGEMSIQKRRIVGPTHVRSGDVIRMSESGPEFSFHIVAAAKPSPAKTRSGGTAPTSPPGVESRTSDPQASPGSDRRTSNVGSLPPIASEPSPAIASPRPAIVPVVCEPRSEARTRDRQPIIWIAAGSAALVVALVALRPASSPIVIVPPVAQAPSNVQGAGQPQPTPPTTPPLSQNKPPESATPAVPVQKPDPAKDLRDQLNEAVFLILVESAERYWPFATCVAVGNDTLLTTAREAAQLAKWRDEGKFKLWVVRPPDKLKFKFKTEIQEIRVLAPFASLSEESTDLFFFDIGLLTVRGPLPMTAPLASPKELDEIDEGFPVACLGFTHEGSNVTSHDKFEPRLTNGKVFITELARNLPGQPARLQLRAEMPQNAFGSIVVNAAGKVVGLYGDAIPEGKRQGLKNLHYATIVTPELIASWLRDRANAKMWVPASTAPTTSQTQNQP
ncbi:MAG: hypothetical protein LLG00_08655, partial [Planctomycetaceae bacterium]|nr:hypothetical protein [Planctomycetaceae bacterium]